MRFSPDAVRRVLAAYPGQGWCLAFSGGLDSSVLLHALAMLRTEHDLPLRAVHVDHGLHPDSPRWAEHCIRAAASLGVECSVVRVRVEPQGRGVEAAARAARYDALAAGLRTNEVVLTAQHANDQAETVLLALMRGSGPAGVAAMPEARTWGVGGFVRPLLHFTRGELEAWAREHGLTWIEDPANRCTTHARNHLRQAVMPALAAYWPGAARSLARSAVLAAEADQLLETLGTLDLDALSDGATLDAEGILALGSPRARNLLRVWFASRGLPAPPFQRLVEVERQLREAAHDRIPEIRWPGGVLRRWAGRVYAARPTLPLPGQWMVHWNGEEPLVLPGGLGTLTLRPAPAGLDARRVAGLTLEVGFMAGGERIRLHPGGPHRALAHLLAEAGVPPWERARVPLLKVAGQIIAVADLHEDADWRTSGGEDALCVMWDRSD